MHPCVMCNLMCKFSIFVRVIHWIQKCIAYHWNTWSLNNGDICIGLGSICSTLRSNIIFCSYGSASSILGIYQIKSRDIVINYGDSFRLSLVYKWQ